MLNYCVIEVLVYEPYSSLVKSEDLMSKNECHYDSVLVPPDLNSYHYCSLVPRLSRRGERDTFYHVCDVKGRHDLIAWGWTKPTYVQH